MDAGKKESSTEKEKEIYTKNARTHGRVIEQIRKDWRFTARGVKKFHEVGKNFKEARREGG